MWSPPRSSPSFSLKDESRTARRAGRSPRRRAGVAAGREHLDHALAHLQDRVRRRCRRRGRRPRRSRSCRGEAVGERRRVGSLMMRRSSRPAMRRRRRVVCRCASLKYEGTVITAWLHGVGEGTPRRRASSSRSTMPRSRNGVDAPPRRPHAHVVFGWPRTFSGAGDSKRRPRRAYEAPDQPLAAYNRVLRVGHRACAWRGADRRLPSSVTAKIEGVVL